MEARLCWESFYTRMDKSGRTTITKRTLKILEDGTLEKQSLTGAVMEMNTEPS
jgi:hypothetical protein